MLSPQVISEAQLVRATRATAPSNIVLSSVWVIHTGSATKDNLLVLPPEQTNSNQVGLVIGERWSGTATGS